MPIERTRGAAVFVSGDSELLLEDVAIRDTHTRETDLVEGRGVNVQEGATVTISRVSVEGSGNIGVYIGDPGTTAAMEDLVVRDTQGTPSGRQGRGVSVESGAQATLSRGLVERNHDSGVLASVAGTSFTINDLVVRDTEPEIADGSDGRALTAQTGAHATGQRIWIERATEVALAVLAGSALTVEDLMVRETRPTPDAMARGRGATFQEGSTATLRRVVFEDNHEVGALVSHDGTHLILEDAVVRRTDSELAPDLSFGMGVDVRLGGSAELHRVLLENNRHAALFVSETEPGLSLEDVLVRDTRSNELRGGENGAGLWVQEASATGSRVRIERSHEEGLVTITGRTTLTDTAIVDTMERECAETTCAGFGAGHGAASVAGGELALDRFEIAGSALCGVLLGVGSSVDLSHGEVRGNLIGACVQEPGFDLARLSADVRYRDNGTPIDGTTLPIPEPTTGVDEL